MHLIKMQITWEKLMEPICKLNKKYKWEANLILTFQIKLANLLAVFPDIEYYEFYEN